MALSLALYVTSGASCFETELSLRQNRGLKMLRVSYQSLDSKSKNLEKKPCEMQARKMYFMGSELAPSDVFPLGFSVGRQPLVEC